MPVKIICPKCGRILGDTEKSLDCNLNCNGCKNTVRVRMSVARVNDYLTSAKGGTDGRTTRVAE